MTYNNPSHLDNIATFIKSGKSPAGHKTEIGSPKEFLKDLQCGSIIPTARVSHYSGRFILRMTGRDTGRDWAIFVDRENLSVFLELLGFQAYESMMGDGNYSWYPGLYLGQSTRDFPDSMESWNRQGGKTWHYRATSLSKAVEHFATR